MSSSYLERMNLLFRTALAAAVFLVVPLAQADDGSIVLTTDKREILASLAPISGPQVTSEGLDGKVVVVTFFASWCPPCHVEFEHLNALYETYHDRGVEIVAVNVFELQGGFNDGGVRLQGFIEDFRPQFSLVEGDKAVREAFGHVARIPTVFVFDRSGEPTLQFVHIRDAEKTNPTQEEVIAAIEAGL
ncbi:MAG: TlpA family protein disulfide reductase [Rhodospirillaceae bacterium]|nr:TlpA family protein disulfide reductase [Rhodospirillaceae bacterium]MBT6512273.1 TlpA family protein disulfide reductase [Rhodospirillaceae bacterium]MBT7613085.1 TlpA family protein disulfide reductase [Rhodospirillaceae bacterium]MBT7646512.1 TlpA family protein disulfide reductase [Rhodospirillaceae bacterium]